MSTDCLVPEISEIARECLIVEHESLGDDYEGYIKELKNIQGRHADLQIIRARSAHEARNYLAERTKPFDLMLLDLELPNYPNGTLHVNEGLKVLKFALKVGAAKAIVVVSGKPEEINTVRRLGVRDFVSKKYFKKEDLQSAVQKNLWQLAIPDSAEILAKRTFKLSPYFERSLIHQFGLYFSRSLHEIDRAGDAIARELLERFGLDPVYDGEDFLLQQLRGIREALQTGKTNWSNSQESLGLSDLSSPQAINVWSVVTDLEHRLMPCMIAKSAIFKIGPLPNETVLGFKSARKVHGDVEVVLSDVEEILSEVVLGGLSELKNDSHETGIELTLSGEADQNWVSIILSDNLPQMHPQDLAKIKQGVGLSCEKRFSRVWGLSVMQHAALQGGGRLSVETTGEGNTIRYRIPRARNG